jgi:hypothetical protein
MIPEAGAREEFKQAVLRHCSVWPDIGEIYAFSRPRFSVVGDSKSWTVINISRHHIELAMVGSGGCTRDKISVDSWFELIEESEIKFVRYS